MFFGGKMQLSKLLIFVGVCLSGVISVHAATETPASATPQVSLYRTFERSIQNAKSYTNKFADVEISVPVDAKERNLATLAAKFLAYFENGRVFD